MLRRLYDWTMNLARHRHAGRMLGFVSFIESSVFPIPTDVLLIPIALSDRARAMVYATIATVTSVAGGMFGYAIGYFLFESVGQPLLDFYGYGDKFTDFAERYNEWGAWIVFIAGVTPFPYKVITIASGVTGLDIFVFTVASILARGLRFYAVCGLIYWFGEPIRTFIEKYLGLLFTAFVVLLIGGFIAVKYVL